MKETEQHFQMMTTRRAGEKILSEKSLLARGADER